MPFDRGPAFSFVERLLGINDARSADPLVEVIVLSKNDPVTGLRLMRSIEHYGLDISRAVFSRGRQTHQYIPAFQMALFLSQDEADVRAAIADGLPAGLLVGMPNHDDSEDKSLRVAFDFDGVLGDDSAETVYKKKKLKKYLEHEAQNALQPLGEGPMARPLAKLNQIQKLEQERVAADPRYEPRLRISLITARNAPAHERAVRSLQSWGVTVDEAFFLGRVEKASVLSVLKPHIFFDDQTDHLQDTTGYYAAVHVPYGIANAKAKR